jgi:4-diphosphocytidyl-2-C-methyl-D-erythritol kinase
VKIRAPAKINLSLRVVGRRADGYHLIDSVMVPVSLYDVIDVRKRRKTFGRRAQTDELIQISCNHPDVPLGKENIVYRAAQQIMEKRGKAQPVRIDIFKRIPVGAGLGGGSTDAAATLIAMNRLLKLRLSRSDLEKIALSLGADVPFFLRGQAARARGIGERLRPLRRLPQFWAVILFPGFPVSTSWVYGKLRRKLTKPMANTSIASPPITFDELTSLLVNDLESVTLRRHPKVSLLKDKLLREGAARALMTGSGSSVFGIFKSQRAALAGYRRLRKEEGAQAFLVHRVG